MGNWIAGLIVTGELLCDSCGRTMRHPERYGYIWKEGESPVRFCEDCSRAKGYLRWDADKKMETFLSGESNGSGYTS